MQITLKDPVLADVFPRLVATVGVPDADLDALRFLVLCLLGFAGFMRISELLKVKLKDISFYATHMSISVSKKKNDQNRQGHTVNISRTGKATSPVEITERFLSKANIRCRLVRTKAGLNSNPLILGHLKFLSRSLGLKLVRVLT